MVGIENAGLKYDSVEVYLAKDEIGKQDTDPRQSETTELT